MLIPKNSYLGHLKLFEVYDDFFGPKCFSVKNQFNQRFLVYWNGDFEGYTEWLYVLVSESKLNDLTLQSICVREVFKNSESGQVLKVTINENDSCNIESLVTANNELLPPKDMFIDPDTIVPHHPEAEWGFKMKISKKNKNHEAQERKTVTKIMDAFSELLESLMKGIESSSRKEPRIYPLAANFGSFEVTLKTSNNENAAIAIEQLNELVLAKTGLDEKLRNLGLDPFRLQELLEIIRDNNSVITLTPKTNTYLKSPFEFGRSGLSEIIEQLNSMNVTFIDSKKVPQANDLDRVIEIVQRKALGEHLTHNSVEGITSDRQLKYHLHAAKCLGLLKDNYSINSSGRFFSLINSKKGQYQYLASQFESAEFGWCWMKWAKVNSIKELDPNTAANFVRESVNGLNEGTSLRRSTCLSAWQKKLYPYVREYE